MLYSDPIIFLIITSSQAIPPWPEETFLRRLTIFRFDFLVEPSGLKTLAPLIVTFNRNLKCNLGLVVKGGVCGCWFCWCLWKANILLPEGWPEVITSPLTPHRLQSVGGICFDFISLPVQWWKWKHNWNSNPIFFFGREFLHPTHNQHVINTSNDCNLGDIFLQHWKLLPFISRQLTWGRCLPTGTSCCWRGRTAGSPGSHRSQRGSRQHLWRISWQPGAWSPASQY